ncbi:hypothetical protein Pla175_16310 [Pirellulimonas nuda]|uniref:Hint domain-containing protein n=1 Tax=Pirellulimonas nuda TaxID=2528009 RepID=A0A518D9U2_9BACT|nr:polymorphic toxin-type HINT domain-containing protein [Pirellulimonas nuda]QDU88257.1 hypothetical protein Pla175_16310 [Pirellulimonas nuda]
MVRTRFVAAVLCVGAASCSFAANSSTTKGSPTDVAASLVGQAIAAGVQGDYASRAQLLAEAVRIAPDYAPARWQSGQVACDGEWVSVADAQRRAAENPLLQERAEAMQQWQESPAAHLQAARWCRDRGLKDEARYHWTMLLQNQPDSREALDALDARWIGGELVLNDEVAQRREAQRERSRAVRETKSRLAGWEARIARDDTPDAQLALDEVRTFDRLEAIPAMEEVSLAPAPARQRDADARRRFSLAFVEALSAHSDQAATESLARHALASPFEEVRNEATWQLAERPWHNFVPMLLDELQPKVELWQNVSVTPGGDVHYQAEIEVAGREADYGLEIRDSVWAHDLEGPLFWTRPKALTAGKVSAEHRLRQALHDLSHDVDRALASFSNRATSLATEVAERNSYRQSRNDALTGVLTGATGHELGDDPQQWWEWWQGLNEFETGFDRPYYHQEDVHSRHNCYRCPKGIVVPSCFTGGTPVWTKTGKQPIESLRPGDFVLSQDVETGELGYQPVLDTTVRRPSPVLRIEVAGEQIEMTLGHPAWVVGQGWRMAKELVVGDRLQHIAGDAEVMESAPVSPAEAYNLVVAETSTYFVGHIGLLVHDNTPRRATTAKSPGWDGR